MSKANPVAILEQIREENPGAIALDGLDEAIIGICRRFGADPLLAYGREKCIGIFMRRDGMTHEEAEEWMEFNVEGLWAGDGTPVFVEVDR
jgi:hypothetical protein